VFCSAPCSIFLSAILLASQFTYYVKWGSVIFHAESAAVFLFFDKAEGVVGSQEKLNLCCSAGAPIPLDWGCFVDDVFSLFAYYWCTKNNYLWLLTTRLAKLWFFLI
jgi:hypothetical protein